MSGTPWSVNSAPPGSPPDFNATSCGAGTKESPPTWTYILGVLLGITASIGINVGNNVQALGLAKQAKSGDTKHNRLFWMGTWTFVIASIVNFGAFGLAPASVLAPLESVQFVSNLLFAKFVNHIVITRRMITGSGLIIFGTVLAIAFGPSRVLQFSVDDLIGFWANQNWIIYLILNLSLAFGVQSLHVVYEKARVAGKALKHSATVLPVTFGVSSALAGSHCVVQAKCMSELFEIFLSEPGCILSSWFFYMTLGLLFVCLYIWLSRLNMALSKYDPLFIIPLLQSNYILFSMITGGLFFMEFSQLSALGWICFVFGISILFFGLYLLAPVDAAPEGSRVHPDSESSTTTCASPPRPGDASPNGSMNKKQQFVDPLAVSVDRLPPASPIAIVEVTHVSDDGVIHAGGTKDGSVDGVPSASLSRTNSKQGALNKPANLADLSIPMSALASAPESASAHGGMRERSFSKDLSGSIGSRPPSANIYEPPGSSGLVAGALGAVVLMRTTTPVVQESLSWAGQVTTGALTGAAQLANASGRRLSQSGRRRVSRDNEGRATRNSRDLASTERTSDRTAAAAVTATVVAEGHEIAFYNNGTHAAPPPMPVTACGAGDAAPSPPPVNAAHFRRISEEALGGEQSDGVSSAVLQRIQQSEGGAEAQAIQGPPDADEDTNSTKLFNRLAKSKGPDQVT